MVTRRMAFVNSCSVADVIRVSCFPLSSTAVSIRVMPYLRASPGFFSGSTNSTVSFGVKALYVSNRSR